MVSSSVPPKPPGLPPSLQHPLLWQGKRRQTAPATLSTGNERLDRLLPGGGWPVGAMTELLTAREGLGELSLLLPCLAKTAQQGGWNVLVDPPWTPYPPAIRGHGVDLQRLLVITTRDNQDALWAFEQALRGLRGGIVMAWLPADTRTAGFTQLRRLQLAARSGRKCAFLFRPAGAIGQATPAALRLHLEADDHNLQVTMLKCRGIQHGSSVRLQRQHRPAELPRPSATTTPGARAGSADPNRTSDAETAAAQTKHS